jgi:hypothetical protein
MLSVHTAAANATSAPATHSTKRMPLTVTVLVAAGLLVAGITACSSGGQEHGGDENGDGPRHPLGRVGGRCRVGVCCGGVY